ncbi:hypothetical protein ULMS_02730 [Patiriisocius marinistellae]|uniref:Uncharacterized protein n=1 Tax=Patiriisocius marinistellae TaxID=2494560 RepID=A0A5J4FXI3_9FLAO|nr:hypothetical protein ULMS_02730 [Patiriisocius marinistellae]
MITVTLINAQTVFRGTVIDQGTNEPIKNARVGVTNQGVGVITNEKGNFTYRKYHEVIDNSSTLKVSAFGYKMLRNDVSAIRQMINNRGIIYLQSKKEEQIIKEVSKKVAVFWDASKRPKNRDVESEKAFLMDYISNNSFSEISLTIFNETIIFKETYNSSKNASLAIPSIIDAIEYKGFSDFGNIKYQEIDEVLLIAQQKPIVGKPQINQEIPFSVLNLNAKEAALPFFKEITIFTNGIYHNAAQSNNQTIISEDKTIEIITGVVASSNKEVNYAMVVKEGSIEEYYTDQNGFFSIPAVSGDELTIYSLGHYPKKIVITDDSFYDITLATKAEILDEVELKGTMSKAPEYAYDEKSQTDKVENGRMVPIRTLYKKDWKKGVGQISEIINGWHGVKSGVGVDGRTYTSVKGMCAKFLVDGIEVPAEAINVSAMAIITIYAPYGSVLKCPARIVITTKFHPDIIDQKLRSYGIDPLKNNNYTEEVENLNTKAGTYFQENIKTGTIVSKGIPLQNVRIFKQGSLKEYVSKGDGTFSLPAIKGDILFVKHLGMYPKTIIVTEAENYSISLTNKAEMLDTVALEGQIKEKSQNQQIETAYGKKDRNVIGYQVESGLSRFIAPTDTDFFTVAQKLPNVVVDLDTRTVFHQRSAGAIKQSPMLVVVDNVPTTQEILRIIDPQTITSVTALANLAATNIYGSKAFGGVLLITTKNNSSSNFNTAKKDYTIKNNDYKEEVPILNFDAITNNFVDSLTLQKSIKIKFETYKKLRSNNIDKVDFYVDMALYFNNIDAGVASVVRSDFAQIIGDNIKALRILAYLNEYAGEYLNAQKIYERILELDPSLPQSYRDVAAIYQETGEFEKSLELYINMLGDQIKGVDFSSLEVPISNELKRLISIHKHKIDFSRLPNDWLTINFNIDVRLTLSWSDPKAPFEFQFVDPKKKFYTWQSSQENQGANVSKEFIVDDADAGKWLVNIRYTGQEGETHIPPYLKYTIYKDFGTPKEEKLVKLVRLDAQLDKVTLDSFVY